MWWYSIVCWGADNQIKKVYNDGIIPRSCGAGNFNECEDAWNPGNTRDVAKWNGSRER